MSDRLKNDFDNNTDLQSVMVTGRGILQVAQKHLEVNITQLRVLGLRK